MLLYSDKVDIQQEVDEKKKNMVNTQDEILFSKKTERDCHFQKKKKQWFILEIIM